MTTLINFSHPLTDEQTRQITAHVGEIQTIAVKCQLDITIPFGPQIVALADQASLTNATLYQAERILVLLPALAPAAALMVAELQGRTGYFPPCVRLAQRPNSVPPVFDLAEIMDLNDQRQEARKRR